MIPSKDEFYRKLRWLMFGRILFTTLLLCSTIILQLGKATFFNRSVIALYGLIFTIFILSFLFRLLLNVVERITILAYVQIAVDTFIVTVIIFMTGSFSSLFSFLYLVVIIYASILLFRRGSMVMATLCSIQYGILVDLEYFGLIHPFGPQAGIGISGYTGSYIIYRIAITMVACFAVAFLSSLLSEQERKTKGELRAMEEHVRRVEKMAAVGEMAAGLAHEIKNPLASLRGSIQYLREELDDPAHEKLMKIILREADRLSTLVSDFLLFAKPPAGRMESIDLKQAISETLELFEKDGNHCCPIQFETQFETPIWIKMDPSHFRQVLWNLLLNASEAIDTGGMITIRIKQIRNQYVTVSITDTGSGMDSETIRSIFDPFFTTKSGGSGLGLSIVHRVLESYDAWIDLESTPGKGTTFSLNLKAFSSPT